jgi:hypothetical protein
MTVLETLLEVPFDDRDLEWEQKFFMAVSQSNVNVLTPEPQEGPDGWPYIMTTTSSDATEPIQKIFQWLSTRGIGLVINPMKQYPDYVFTYGMIWHFRQTGLFYRQQADVKTGVVNLNEGQKIKSGAPTEEYLPSHVRKVLRDFFRDQGLLQPKILMISEDGKHYDLAFSLESIGNPPMNEHQGIAEAISWFLPPHYSILLTSEKSVPGFINL